MMHTYARIDGGVVAEIILPVMYETPDPTIEDITGKDVYEQLVSLVGQEVPVDARFTAEFVAALVDISSVSPLPEVGWTYNGSSFAKAS